MKKNVAILKSIVALLTLFMTGFPALAQQSGGKHLGPYLGHKYGLKAQIDQRAEMAKQHPYLLLSDNNHNSVEKQMALRQKPIQTTTAQNRKAQAQNELNVGYQATMLSQSGMTLHTFAINAPEYVFEDKGSIANNINGGGTVIDGKLHFINYNAYTSWDGLHYTVEYYRYNLNNMQLERNVTSGLDLTVTASCVAYDETDKKVYGVFNNADATGIEFGTISYSNFRRTKIAALDTMIVSMAAVNGHIYGFTIGGNFVEINKTSGKLTIIGPTGLHPLQQPQGAAYDSRTGKLYWNCHGTDWSSNLYEIDITTGKATYVGRMQGGSFENWIYVMPPAANDKAPDQITDLTVEFNKAETSGHIRFTTPTICFDETPLTGSLTYYVKVNGQSLVRSYAKPGNAIDVPVTCVPGQNTFTVYTSNLYGNSVTTSTSKWVGQDYPVAVDHVILDVDKAKATANIHWNRPTKSIHDGYIDPDSITFDVIRLPDSASVARNTADTTAIDSVAAAGIHYYSYMVTPKNGTLSGQSTKSDGSSFGHSFDVPYREDFTSANNWNTFTVVKDTSNGKWRQDYGGASSVGPSDAWLITPAIHLTAGLTYELTTRIEANGGTNWPTTLGVAYGKDLDPKNYTTLLADSVFTNRNYFYYLRKRFTPTETGDYHIGYQDHSTIAGSYTIIKDIVLDLAKSDEAPDSVTNLTLTPDPEGELVATLSFNAPTKTISGKNLSSLLKVNVVQGEDETVVRSFVAPKPGELLTYVDSSAVNGTNSYKIIPYSEQGLGQESSISAFVGEDVPARPKNIQLRDNFDGSVYINWESPGAVGANGQYVNEKKLVYNLYDISAGTIINSSKDLNATVKGLATSGDRYLGNFGVRAQSRTGMGLGSVAEAYLGGDAYQLPYKESFENENLSTFMWSFGNSSNGFATTSLSEDGDNGSIYWYASKGGEQRTLGTHKINIAKATKPVLQYSYYAMPGHDVTLTVVVNNSTLRNDTVSVIRYAALQGNEGWRKVYVDLSNEKTINGDSCHYIYVKFICYANSINIPIELDHIIVHDEIANDLEAQIDAPSKIHTGDSVSVGVKVVNNGGNTAKGFTVNLTANDKQLASVDGGTIALHEDSTFTFSFKTAATTPSTINLKATVDYALDGNQDDNTATTEVKVYNLSYPKPTDLAASADEDGVVSLTWEKPDTTVTTVEDFDFYDAWSINNIGSWSLWDEDGGSTFIDMSIQWPHSYAPYAFLVFNPVKLGFDIDDPANANVKPVSGDQFLLSCGIDPYSTASGDSISSDWLISPELNGHAQTISYYGNKIYNNSPANTVEILYSTGSTAPTDFKSIKTDVVNAVGWRQFTADLPEGAKRFALHARSQSVLGIDDIKYAPAGVKLVGFNIFRDSVLIATVGADETFYEDHGASLDVHNYQVSAIYGDGESEASDATWIIVTSINNVRSAEARVSIAPGRITIAQAQGLPIGIYTIVGLQIYSGTGSKSSQVNVQPGQYIVKVGAKTYNIIVR